MTLDEILKQIQNAESIVNAEIDSLQVSIEE